MPRNISIHLILLFFSMAVVRLAIAQDIEELRKGVVKVIATQVSDGQTKTNRGSGFIVELYPDAAMIVTVSHVVEGQDIQLSVEFSVRGDASFPAQVKRMRGGRPKRFGRAGGQKSAAGVACPGARNPTCLETF